MDIKSCAEELGGLISCGATSEQDIAINWLILQAKFDTDYKGKIWTRRVYQLTDEQRQKSRSMGWAVTGVVWVNNITGYHYAETEHDWHIVEGGGHGKVYGFVDPLESEYDEVILDGEEQ